MEKLCSFHKHCLFAGEGCDATQAKNCDEASRKKKLEQTLCPVMVAANYPEALCACNIPQIRAAIPANMVCVKDGKCFMEFLDEKTRAQIIQNCNDGGNIVIPQKNLSGIAATVVRESRKIATAA